MGAQIESIRPDVIEVSNRHRALDEAACDRLAASMKEIGLRQPITVRVVDMMVIDGHEVEGVPVLVAGRHRLEAAKRLGWSHIDCIEVDDDQLRAELWEIAENLHRHDLTKEQRDQHIRRYAEVLVAIDAERQIEGQNGPQLKTDANPKGAGRPKEVARKIADETGLSAKTIRRALNPAPVSVAAEPPKEVFDVHEMARRRLVSAWNGATEGDRQWFRDWIDTPVMDQRYG